MAFLILIIMIFLHCIADYTLQGVLVNLKQKKWWIDNCDGNRTEQYKNDYKIAMLVHSFEWAFMIQLPMIFQMFIYESTALMIIIYSVILVLNIFYHYVIDDAKANKKRINLGEDQLLHLGQIFITWIMWLAIFQW